MKRNSLNFRAPMCLFFAMACFAGATRAQENGYINGATALFSFSPKTGTILNSFDSAGTAEPFAVAEDDVTIYMPPYFDTASAVYQVSGKTGQIVGSAAVNGIGRNGVVLTKDGTKAFVATGGGFGGGVSVIDTATMTVAAFINQGVFVGDVALSPDDATLYVAVYCIDICNPPLACPVKIGICAFNASTLELEWQVKGVSGLLSVSNDGSMLYSAGFLYGNRPGYPLNAINTSTLAVTNPGVPVQKDAGPMRIITDPASHYAVVIERGASGGFSTPAAAYLLNTATNKFVETLFTSAPGGMTVTNAAGGAAFAPDGKSVWMLLSCGVGYVQNCSDESGQIYLAGFSLPSGAVISNQVIPGEFWGTSENIQSIAFPR